MSISSSGVSHDRAVADRRCVIGVFGLVIGSFLNVVIYRVPRDESILFPSSHCPTCNDAGAVPGTTCRCSAG